MTSGNPPQSFPFEEVDRARALLRAAGLDFALLSSPPNVTYVTGYQVPAGLGPVSDLSAGLPPALGLVAAEGGPVHLLVPDAGLGSIPDLGDRLAIESFRLFGHFEPVDLEREFDQAFLRVVEQAGLSARARVGVELNTFPTAVERRLDARYPGLELRNAAPALAEARRTKTPRELELLRRVAQVADAGQARLVELSAEAGRSELELWDEVVAAMERCVGGPLPVSGELVTGPRTAVLGAPGPTEREVGAGDFGLLDVTPRVGGYWADCCNGFVFGSEPAPAQARYFTAARESFEAAVEALRPGAKACDVAEAVRVTMERHGLPVAHHSGHQIGASANEPPRLVPYDTTTIEAGMVFAVEPGAYTDADGGIGARAEKMVLVTEAGSETLARFPWGIAAASASAPTSVSG